MTPFGALFRYYREERGISQQQMAGHLGLDSKQISAIETGRRRQPNNAVLDKIRCTLKLSDSEFTEIQEAAGYSSYVVRIPRDISAQNLRLIHKLMNSVSRLRSEELTEVQRDIDTRLIR